MFIFYLDSGKVTETVSFHDIAFLVVLSGLIVRGLRCYNSYTNHLCVDVNTSDPRCEEQVIFRLIIFPRSTRGNFIRRYLSKVPNFRSDSDSAEA